MSVAIERIREASRRLDAIMARPAPLSSRDEPGRSFKEAGWALLEMNPLAATIENGLHLLQGQTWNELGGKGDLSRVVRFCLKRAIECQRRMRELIKGMGVSARRLAELSEPRTESREVATKRADFYASLLERSGLLTGTGFERPLLSAALAKLNKAPASPTLEQERPKEEP